MAANKSAVKRAHKAASKTGVSGPSHKDYMKALTTTRDKFNKAVSKIGSPESARRKGGTSGTSPNRNSSGRPRGGVSGRTPSSRGGR